MYPELSIRDPKFGLLDSKFGPPDLKVSPLYPKFCLYDTEVDLL